MPTSHPQQQEVTQPKKNAKRGSAFPTELSKLGTMLEAFAERNAWAKVEVKKLLQQQAIVVQSSRNREHGFKKTLDRIRACANTAFNGRYSFYLRTSEVLTDDDKEFLKGAQQFKKEFQETSED